MKLKRNKISLEIEKKTNKLYSKNEKIVWLFTVLEEY